jgi:hypothetical protein
MVDALLLIVGADHFGMMLGSPPGVPGGGITGVTPPPTGGADMPGSIPAGGQITPFERDSWSLKLGLPVVSPGVAGAMTPRWHSAAGGMGIKGRAGVCDCAEAHEIPPDKAMPAARNKDRMMCLALMPSEKDKRVAGPPCSARGLAE